MMIYWGLGMELVRPFYGGGHSIPRYPCAYSLLRYLYRNIETCLQGLLGTSTARKVYME